MGALEKWPRTDSESYPDIVGRAFLPTCCSCPSPGTMRKAPNFQIAQQLCLEGVREPRVHNTGVKNVWGRRPHTFFALLLHNLGPQTPSGHNCCAILVFFILYLFTGLPGGVDNYSGYGQKAFVYEVPPWCSPRENARPRDVFSYVVTHAVVEFSP